MKVSCIAASNILASGEGSTSYKLCNIISDILSERSISCEIIDLRAYDLSPCIGCGACYKDKRCIKDSAFNKIYEKLIHSDALFIVSPHYAPIPAKLCMLLEKMEQVAFLHWWKDNSYRSELNGLPTGVISHGGGSDWALKSYKAMVNDTIANALDTIQCKLVPYDEEWKTGISLPLNKVVETESIFPVQEYDWAFIRSKIQKYVEKIIYLYAKWRQV